jgi:type IV secretory pathway VirB2 component (pilin)
MLVHELGLDQGLSGPADSFGLAQPDTRMVEEFAKLGCNITSECPVGVNLRPTMGVSRGALFHWQPPNASGNGNFAVRPDRSYSLPPSPCLCTPAFAAEFNMPWGQPLQQIPATDRRPGREDIAVLIITTGPTRAFGDTSCGFRRLVRIFLGLSIAFAAPMQARPAALMPIGWEFAARNQLSRADLALARRLAGG